MQEELLFDKSLQMIQLVIRVFGFNITREKRSLMQNLILTSNILCHMTDCVCTSVWIINGILGGKGFTQLTQIAPCTIYGIVTEVKVYYMVVNENKIRVLTNNLRGLEIKAKGFACQERDSLIKPEIVFLNVAVKVLKVLSCLVILVFNVLPLTSTAENYFTTGQLIPELPLLAAYPFDETDLRFWPFVYIHQVWSIISCLIVCCASDGLFCICCSHIIMQFKLLQHQLQEIIPVKSSSAGDSVDQAAIKAKFQELIKWHQEIISATKTLENINSVSTLIVFLASSLLICLTGFNVVTAVDDRSLLAKYLTMLLLSMVQIFFLCFFGDVLSSASGDVANAVFNSRWYRSNLAMRKNTLLVNIRAQKPCKLTAAGFADVNLRAYMKVMSTSWSYFALLQTMYSSRG